MNMVMRASPRLTLLTLGAVPLLMSLLARYETLVVVVPMIPLRFHTGSPGVQHFRAAWSPQQSSTKRRAAFTFADVRHRWPQLQLGPTAAWQ